MVTKAVKIVPSFAHDLPQRDAMPTISAFFGTYIRMYLRDHPPPHFHAVYGEHRAFVAIADGEVLEGRSPSVARRLVRDWTMLHRRELADN